MGDSYFETHINIDISKQFITANRFILTQWTSGPHKVKQSHYELGQALRVIVG